MGEPSSNVRGDALDKDTLEQAVRGQDASLYALGTKTIGRTTLFSESTRILIDAMERSKVKRLVCITGIGAGEMADSYTTGFCFRSSRNGYTKTRTFQEGLIQKSSLDWVLVRPAMFREGTVSRMLVAVTDVRGVTLTRVSPAEVAAFLLDQSP